MKLVSQLVLQLDSCRLHMICEDVVKPLPLLCKVEALESFEPSNLVESNDAALIKGYQQLASRT